MRDVVGAWLSLLCMIHCFLPIILVSVGASLGAHQLAESMHQEWFHFVLLIPIVLLLTYSLPKSFRQHRNHQPIWLALLGLTTLVLALVIDEQYETPITMIGSVFVISAHLINRKITKQVSI